MLVGGWGRLRMRYQIRTYPARPLCPFLAYFEELVQIIWQSDGSYAHRHTHTDRHTDAQTPWGSLQHIQSNGLNINKIVQVNVIIFNWQFIFIFFTGNICLIDKILSNSLSTGPKWWKQTLYLPNSMEIQKFVFWREFCHFFENAVNHNFQSYQLILLIFNSKYGTKFY